MKEAELSLATAGIINWLHQNRRMRIQQPPNHKFSTEASYTNQVRCLRLNRQIIPNGILASRVYSK
jgi:hypothetical protein